MTEPEPTPPQPPEPPAAEEVRGNPWERRTSLGVMNGLIEALKLFVSSPTTGFAQTLKRGDYGSPLLFAIIVGWIGVIIGQLWSLLFGASILSMLPGDVRNQIPMALLGSSGLVMSLVFAPVFIIIGLFIWSAILHLCLVIVGGLSESQAGFEGTFRVVSYASVAQLANLLPMVGDLVCLVWSIILAVIGVQQLHKTSQGKAIAAVVIPLVLCCICVALGFFIAGASLLTMFANQ